MKLLNRLRTWVGPAANSPAAGGNPGESLPMSPVGSRAASLVQMAAEAGAEAGLLGRDIATAIVRLETEVAAVAQEMFTVEDTAVLAAQEESALAEVATLRTAAGATPHSAGAPGRESHEPAMARRRRLAMAATSAVVFLGAALQSVGLIGWLGWVVLAAGATFLVTISPEAGLAIRRLADAAGAWQTRERARRALLAAEARLAPLQEARVRSLDAARLRTEWLESTRQRVLAELRLQQDRGAHAGRLAG